MTWVTFLYEKMQVLYFGIPNLGLNVRLSLRLKLKIASSAFVVGIRAMHRVKLPHSTWMSRFWSGRVLFKCLAFRSVFLCHFDSFESDLSWHSSTRYIRLFISNDKECFSESCILWKGYCIFSFRDCITFSEIKNICSFLKCSTIQKRFFIYICYINPTLIRVLLFSI